MKLLHDPARCTACGACTHVCPQQLLHITDRALQIDDPIRCMGCFGCEEACPHHAQRVLRTPVPGVEPEIEPAPAPRERWDLVVVGAREALEPAAAFITDALVKATEMNGRIKALPMKLTEEDFVSYFQVMQHASYPTLLFGSPAQQGWLFTRLMLRHAFDFLRTPRLLKMMTGDL